MPAIDTVTATLTSLPHPIAVTYCCFTRTEQGLYSALLAADTAEVRCHHVHRLLTPFVVGCLKGHHDRSRSIVLDGLRQVRGML